MLFSANVDCVVTRWCWPVSISDHSYQVFLATAKIYLLDVSSVSSFFVGGRQKGSRNTGPYDYS